MIDLGAGSGQLQDPTSVNGGQDTSEIVNCYAPASHSPLMKPH